MYGIFLTTSEIKCYHNATAFPTLQISKIKNASKRTHIFINQLVLVTYIPLKALCCSL